MKYRVFVIGGAAVDITGTPDSLCRLRDSNLGRVRTTVGGVGKNIAKRLTGYDVEVELVTAIGKGFHASLVRDDCLQANVDLAHAITCDAPTATYLSVLDEDGDLLVGISDMSVLDRLTPDYLAPLLPMLNQASLVVLDGNLSPETLAYLCTHLTARIFYDPVSCAKSKRIGTHIGRCYAIKPNRFEAGFLSGKSCDTLRGVYRASDWLLEQGVQRVFISLGAEGVFWADANGNGVVPSACTEVVDTTGAGDAMGAAIIYGCLEQMPTQDCAIFGNDAAARICERRGAF